MTTESRMREALEKALSHLNCLAASHPHLSYPSLRDEIREALSSPARRTSYEWVDRAGFTHRVRWGPSARDGWRVEFWGDKGWSAPVPSSRELGVLAAAIATLAGLTLPEEES